MNFDLNSELYPVESLAEGFDAVVAGKVNATSRISFLAISR